MSGLLTLSVEHRRGDAEPTVFVYDPTALPVQAVIPEGATLGFLRSSDAAGPLILVGRVRRGVPLDAVLNETDVTVVARMWPGSGGYRTLGCAEHGVWETRWEAVEVPRENWSGGGGADGRIEAMNSIRGRRSIPPTR